MRNRIWLLFAITLPAALVQALPSPSNQGIDEHTNELTAPDSQNGGSPQLPSHLPQSLTNLELNSDNAGSLTRNGMSDETDLEHQADDEDVHVPTENDQTLLPRAESPLNDETTLNRAQQSARENVLRKLAYLEYARLHVFLTVCLFFFLVLRTYPQMV